MDNSVKQLVATGVAGFAVSMEILATVGKSGAIPNDTLLGILHGALSAVEGVDAAAQHEGMHEILRMARELLGCELTQFREQATGHP